MMQARMVVALIGPLLLAWAVPAMASEDASFTGHVEVPDQSRAAREEVLDEVLADVLRGATGDPDVAERSGVASLLAKPGDLLQRFSYRRKQADDGDQQLELVARFDGDSVRQALIQAGVPVWRRARPEVLAWVAVEDGDGQRTLVGSDQGADWRQRLVDAAAELGVELTFPLLDLEDQRQVRFSDVAGGFDGPVREASRRYATPLVLMGSLRAANGQWQGRWQLFGAEDGQWDWRDLAGERSGAVEAWARGLAARLRERYTVLPDANASGSLLVRINGVGDAKAMGWVQETLRDLSGVTAVTLRRVEPERVRFGLSLNVDRERVVGTLDRNPALERSDAASGEARSDTPAAGPLYRLQR